MDQTKQPGDGAAAPITGATVLAIAAPIAVSNATLPIQGAVDTALIGQMGVVHAQAAVGLGSEIFSLLLGSFNFLQIGVSGLTAQAMGARDRIAMVDTLARGLLTALAIAAVLLVLQWPLRIGMLALFEESADANALATSYFNIRIWGAPAELMNYALLGWFAGQGATRTLFVHQLAITALNVALSVAFVRGLGLGVDGVALGTAIAAALGLPIGLWFARRLRRAGDMADWRFSAPRVLERAAVRRMLTLNRDVFIRTLLLIFAFTWLARLGSQQGDAMLAANAMLLQLFLITAHGLDGFAIAAETLVGRAAGARDPAAFNRATRLTFVYAAALSLAFAALFMVLAAPIVDLFTAAAEVRALALEHFFWAGLIPVIGVAAFLFDGVFVGATASREMRDGMILATGAYLPLSLIALEWFGNHGVWAAVWIWLILRALTLWLWYPRVRRRLTGA